MTRKQITKKMEEQVRQTILSYAIFRPESAIVIAMTMLLMSLSLLDLPWYPGAWQLWLLFGIIGEALIILTTLRDDKFYQHVLDNLLQQEIDVEKLRTPELKQKLIRAKEYHQSVIAEIKREEDAMDDYLLEITQDLEAWIVHLYHLAKGLDVYRHDAVIAQDMKTVPQELERLKRSLARKGTAGSAQEELKQAIAAKQAHWDSLQKIDQTMAKTALQLENTLSAIGTIYSQIVLLSSKEVDRSRAQRLQADMTDQVRALEDLTDAMDEVYSIDARQMMNDE